jgi:hypothetical protein
LRGAQGRGKDTEGGVGCATLPCQFNGGNAVSRIGVAMDQQALLQAMKDWSTPALWSNKQWLAIALIVLTAVVMSQLLGKQTSPKKVTKKEEKSQGVVVTFRGKITK